MIIKPLSCIENLAIVEMLRVVIILGVMYETRERRVASRL